MPAHPEFQEKLDVLDIIIKILKDHEETLSRLADRFDEIYGNISEFEEKILKIDRALERLGRLRVKNLVGTVGVNGPLVAVKCSDWAAFKAASQGALLVAFEVVDGHLVFSSVSDLFIFTYSSDLSDFKTLVKGESRGWVKYAQKVNRNVMALSGGLFLGDKEISRRPVFNFKVVKQWLSAELGVPERRILEGRVLG